MLLVKLAVMLGLNAYVIFAKFPDFEGFDSSGYTLHSQILATDCEEDVQELINTALGGNPKNDAFEFPTVNLNLTHIDCIDDEVLGSAINQLYI